MTNYKEIMTRCMYCPGLEMCSSELADVILMPNIQIQKNINCEYFSNLCDAIKEYVHNEILKELTNDIKKENEYEKQ